MATRALVLGGGGPVGIAWESGLAAGLAAAGINVAEADFIVGTSAGSVVGAQLALGRSAESLAASQMRDGPATPATVGASGGAPAPDLTGLMGMMMKLASFDGPPEAMRAELGAFALAARTVPEEAFISGFGRMDGMAAAQWPGHKFTCTAVDALDGQFVTWTGESGVELGRAVASSCSVPGIFPPITIHGRRYIDGGMRSATNADLAESYERVIVVSVTGSTNAPAGTPQAAMMERTRARFEGELAAIRVAGGEVLVITPDAGALRAFGVNLMDASRRPTVAQEGIRQGKVEAGRVRDFWA
jgi:NTE family protein